MVVRHEDVVADATRRRSRASARRWIWPGTATLPASLPLSRHTYSRPDPDKWRVHEAEIERTRPIWAAESERASSLAGQGSMSAGKIPAGLTA